MYKVKNLKEEIIEDISEKNLLPCKELMETYEIMEKLDIHVDYNNFETKLIRMYHWLQWIKAVENER